MNSKPPTDGVHAVPPAEPGYPTGIEFIVRGVLVHSSAVFACRQPGGSVVYLPGGHVEPGETASAALRRELDEEFGLGDAAVGRCLAVAEHRFVQRGRARHEVLVVFHVEHPAVRADRPRPTFHALEPGLEGLWVEPGSPDAEAMLPRDLLEAALRAHAESSGCAWLSLSGGDGAG